MAAWQELDEALADLERRLGATHYLLSDAGKAQLSPCVRHAEEVIERFEAAYQLLRARFGESFLRKGKGQRVLHQGDHETFAAEVLLRSYLLVFLFEAAPNFFTVRSELDLAKPVLELLIERLPPLDGGGRSAAQSVRRS